MGAKKKEACNTNSEEQEKVPENAEKHTESVKSVGRPSEFTQEVADRICQSLMEGMSLRKICLADDMPNRTTVFRWIATQKEFRNQYACAREIQADTYADEIVDISDDGRNDTYLDEDGMRRVDHDVIARSRLRVDARKWHASKLAPKKYGEKVQIGGAADLPPVQSNVTVDAAEAYKLLLNPAVRSDE